MTACSADHGPASESSSEGATGKLDVALDIAPGVTLSTIDYSITGPGSFTGSFEVTNSTTITATIGPIPVATGYTLTLSTTTGATCNGSATFDITAHLTTPVTVHMSCRTPSTTGSLVVNGALNVCPQIDGLQATPSEVLYKRINAPFGRFAMDMLTASTKALKGSDSGDATYTSKEASIASLTTQRDARRADPDGARQRGVRRHPHRRNASRELHQPGHVVARERGCAASAP